MSLLKVQNLSVSFTQRGLTQQAVRNLSLAVEPGEVLGIVGESGSGKSVSCYALLGLIPSPPGRIDSGTALFEERDLLDCSESELRSIRGDQIAMVFQDPMTCLNPFLSVGEQIMEPLLHHRQCSRKDARHRAIELLDEVGIDRPELNFNRYPFEFSGGMRQRVMIAMALITEPKLLIADEPTTALDVTIQAQVLTLLKDLQAKRQFAVIFISHDLAVVRNLANRVVVMRQGEVVEHGSCDAVFNAPRAAYTKALLAAVPHGAKVQRNIGQRFVQHLDQGFHHDGVETKPLLEVRKLVAGYKAWVAGRTQFNRVVDDVSLYIGRGEILGLVGESGSGKSTIGRAIVRLLDIQSGSIHFDGKRIDHLDEKDIRPLRTRIQMIFQDPYASLNPRMTVFEALAEPLLFHQIADKSNVAEKVSALMCEVGLAPELVRKYPHEFSGGQRQRIAIGRALACKPELIVADEPVSALDVTVQAQILELLLDLVAKYGLSLLFISHDLSVVRVLSDRVLVLKNGRVVEHNSTEALWSDPQHDYTRSLLAAAPVSE